jgi:hypothetical protein
MEVVGVVGWNYFSPMKFELRFLGAPSTTTQNSPSFANPSTHSCLILSKTSTFTHSSKTQSHLLPSVFKMPMIIKFALPFKLWKLAKSREMGGLLRIIKVVSLNRTSQNEENSGELQISINSESASN